MHITLDEFNEASERELMNESFNAFADELNESLGNLQPAGASPVYIKIIKAALKQKEVFYISPNSKIISIEGQTFEEFVKDLRASKKGGEFGLVYIGTASGTHVIVNNEPGFSEKSVGMNTDVKTLTLGKHPVTGEDKLEVYDGSGWRSTFRAQKVKDLKTRLEIEAEGYKGFIVLKDYDVVRLRGERQANKRVDDKYATRADYVTGEEATDFYRDAKKQAEVNRKLKMNAFPSVDKLSWADLVKLHEALAGIRVGDDTPRTAQFGREIANNITSNLHHPSFTDNGLAIFSFDMNGEDYRLILGVKGLFMEKW